MSTLEQRTKVIALFSSMWGVASVIGPLVGGYLTAYTRLSWRWCFYIILPFGLLAAAMIYWGLSGASRTAQKHIARLCRHDRPLSRVVYPAGDRRARR